MSDDRLRDYLSRAGMPTAAISVLDRPSLLAAWAELVATGRDKPTTRAPAATASDPELEKQRLEFEERKWAQEFATDSAQADHCARLQIIFTYLLIYLIGYT